MKTSCSTYFAIKGDFDPHEVTYMLGLMPSKIWCVGDDRNAAEGVFDFALWEYGHCQDYEFDVELQCLKTIADLRSKVKVLQKIKKMYDVDYILSLVPSVHPGEKVPQIGFQNEIIEFCYLSGTFIDIDMSVGKK